MSAAKYPPSIDRSHALFVDFDGTLVDLAARPESVRVDPQLVSVLLQAQQFLGGALAILTGRRLEDVDALLPGLRFAGAGLHGAQIRAAPGGPTTELAEPTDLGAALAEAIGPWPGLRLEDKGLAVAVHYREAPLLAAQALKLLEEVVADHPQLEIVSGKFIYEARPRGLDKGKALAQLMANAPFKGRKPVFLGDDRTDEDAIVTAQSMGGLGIKVGPGSTAAHCHLIDPQAVMIWLRDALHQTAAHGA